MAEDKKTETQTETQIQPQIVVHSQYVKDFSFENPNAPKTLMNTEGQPEIEINVNVNANALEQARQYEVVLSMKATAKRGDEHMFVTELAYAAVLSIGEGIEEKMLHPMVMIEGPRMLFPFARHTLSSMTQAGGFMPLNIQPIDFVRLYQAGVEAQQGQGAPKASVPSDSGDEINLDNLKVEGDKETKAKKASGKKSKAKDS